RVVFKDASNWRAYPVAVVSLMEDSGRSRNANLPEWRLLKLGLKERRLFSPKNTKLLCKVPTITCFSMTPRRR
ncbi:unnamed protein product, partial [Allacma fusca]